GVFVNDAPGNVIGGTTGLASNIISGNGSVGIRISGVHASGNVVRGNLIGTDATGLVKVPNVDAGIFILNAPNNVIGSPGAGRNVISGNGIVGLQIFGPSAAGNRVLGNFIGTDASGTRR